jgi:hypothetical protein
LAWILQGLWESYEPMGVIEESLVQTIAACWWRKARVIRAENGEIRMRLDTVAVERALRDSDKVNLILAVSKSELGFFSPENPADKIPLREQWTVMQGVQTTLRADCAGLACLRALLEKAKAEMASDGYLSEGTRAALACDFRFWDYVFALICSQAAPPAAKAENQSVEAVDDKTDAEKCAAVIASIDDRLEKISAFREYALERQKLSVDAEERSFSLPPTDATDKILRYESHLDRQLYRAMDQLERLQRQRRGESVPPPPQH